MATVSVRAHARRREVIQPANPSYRGSIEDKWAYYVETNDPDVGDMSSNKILVRKLQSGALTISDESSLGSESFIYLYPDQVVALKKLLAKR